MTNIGLVGDVHGNAMVASAAVSKLKEQDADRIIFLGDFGYRFSPAFVRELDEVSSYTGLQIEWLPGNHENFDYLEKIDYDLGRRFTCHRTGDVLDLGDNTALVIGGATSVDRPWRDKGSSWWPQESLTDEDIRKCADVGEVDFILSHDAPWLPPMLRNNNPGFDPLELEIGELHRYKYRMILKYAKPTDIWHGHYHVSYDETYNVDGFDRVQVHGLDCEYTNGNTRLVRL